MFEALGETPSLRERPADALVPETYSTPACFSASFCSAMF